MAKANASRHWLGLTSAALLVAAALASCQKVEGCEYTGSCTGAGGASEGGAGTNSDDAGTGGEAPNAGTGGAAEAGAPAGGNGGAAGGQAGATSAPCDGACVAPNPVCDEATNRCVECAGNTDCSGATPVCDVELSVCVECTRNLDCPAETPVCDPEQNTCVECLEPAQCTERRASHCEGGVCGPCSRDGECAHLAGSPVCDAGTCVQCLPGKEGACGVNSCNPATRRCTRTPRESVGLCRPCVADSECLDGSIADPETRCVPMEFAGTARPGGFCLRRSSKVCNSPFFQMPAAVASLSGAPAELYCGINTAITRCEAVLDLIESRRCGSGASSACGCVRDANDDCVGAGTGGQCETVTGMAGSCTYPCVRALECPLGTTCTADTPYCH